MRTLFILFALCIVATAVADWPPLTSSEPAGWPALPSVSCPGGVCPVTPEPKQRTWGIVGYIQRCPTCPMVPQYGWIEPEPTEKEINAAASRLAAGGLGREEERRLAEIVDAPALKKAIRQEWSLGTCLMICPQHGSILYDVFEDGSKKPAANEQNGGCEDGACGCGGRFRLFGRRR